MCSEDLLFLKPGLFPHIEEAVVDLLLTTNGIEINSYDFNCSWQGCFAVHTQWDHFLFQPNKLFSLYAKMYRACWIPQKNY